MNGQKRNVGAGEETTGTVIQAATLKTEPQEKAGDVFPEVDLRVGHIVDVLRQLPSGHVRTVVTSPPYWNLRDYQTDGVAWPNGWRGNLGHEPTPDQFAANLVDVFREVRRVLADDGTVWLNLGDSYAATGGNAKAHGGLKRSNGKTAGPPAAANYPRGSAPPPGLKPKDLVGIPWRVAFALQADGWFLRSEIIWAKPDPMPESMSDRPTKAHETIFLLAKSREYFFDQDAVREPCAASSVERMKYGLQTKVDDSRNDADAFAWDGSDDVRQRFAPEEGRNIRTVWTMATANFDGAHFATFPPKLVRTCIRAGSAAGDRVLDPFTGSGTVGLVAIQEGRAFVGAELNPEYAAMAEDRMKFVQRPLFAGDAP